MDESCCSAAKRSESVKDDAHALLTDDNNDGLTVDDTLEKIDDVVDLNIIECPHGCTTSKECELDRCCVRNVSTRWDEKIHPAAYDSTSVSVGMLQ